MSFKTLPLLFINLGGEMMYILDQRLRAQNIPQEKSKKVVHDIVSTMFNKRFMEELFKPQELYSKKAMRTVFDRLAHASIMRLNAASMDKLYDLMTMAFKYQVSLSLQPKDVLLVTLNHMDAIRSFIEDNPTIKEQVDNVYRLVLQNYGAISHGEFQLIRQTLLNFFQDMHIRVSIFLKDKVQNSNGRFALPTFGPVPWNTEIPGTIRIFNGSGEQVKKTEFQSTAKYVNLPKEPSFDVRGERVTKLGTNMYSIARPLEATVMSPYKGSVTAVSDLDSHNPNPNSKAQLDLLSHLIGLGGGGGGKIKKGGKAEFRINLFNTDEEEEQAAASRPVLAEDPGSKVIRIDASKKKRSEELNRIMGELTVEDNGGDDDDLLDLMDKA